MAINKKLVVTAPLAFGALMGASSYHASADVLLPQSEHSETTQSQETTPLKFTEAKPQTIKVTVVGAFSQKQLKVLEELSARKATGVNIASIKSALGKISQDDRDTLFKANDLDNSFEYIIYQKSIQAELQHQASEIKNENDAIKFKNLLVKINSQLTNQKTKSVISALNTANEKKISQFKSQQAAERQAKIDAENAKEEEERKAKEAEAEKIRLAKETETQSAPQQTQATETQHVDSPTPPQNYASHTGTQSAANTYVWGNCTWGVKEYFGTAVGGYWGNAAQWLSSAAAEGYQVDNNPVAGSSVAVFQGGAAGSSVYYGHVAVIQEVQGDRVKLYEMNVAGLGVWSTRWVSASEISGVVHV